MPKLATGAARLAQRLREKATAASAPPLRDPAVLPRMAVQPDIVEPDVIEQGVDVVFCPEQIDGG
jgi:hypothetical protein